MVAVWAPAAAKVDLLVKGKQQLLERTERGWWRSDFRLPSKSDYQFVVNGEVFPDPRSPWQPNGIHGSSRAIDHREFKWMDQHWQAKPLASAVFYELHVGTFTSAGTFDAVIEHLDHLVDLGIWHVELMPVAEFLGDYGWGYDGVCLYAPHHAYGGPEGLKRLVDACHAKGLAVILDVVYNHLGPSGNYLPRFGPYFTDRHSTPWGAALNFDGPESDEVRHFFCDNAVMWLRDYHIDGLRLDAVHAISDSSACHFLEELATVVDELKTETGRHLVLIAESDLNDPRVVRSWELGGFGLDAQWSDDIHHALHTVLTGEKAGYYADFGTLSDLATAFTAPYVYAGRYSAHRRRRHGRPAQNLVGSRFLAYLQNHDQLGNRAQGDRICHLVNTDRVKIGAALVLLSPYVPMLFQGEEWAASSPFQFFVDFGSEPDLAKAVVAGRQREFEAFGWKPEEVPNPTDRRTFQRSKLDWQELDRDHHREMIDWHKQLICLRRAVPALSSGRLDCVTCSCSEQDQWVRIDRGPVTIACNFALVARAVPLSALGEREVLLASKPGSELRGDSARLPAESVAILKIVSSCP